MRRRKRKTLDKHEKHDLRKTFVETGLFYAVAYCDYPTIIFHRSREVSMVLFQVHTSYFYEIIDYKMRPPQRAKSIGFK